jgi:phage-related protein
MPIIVQALLDVLDVVIENIDIIIEAGIQLIDGLITGLMEALPILLEKAPVLIDKFLNAIFEELPVIWEAVTDLLLRITDYMTKPENLELFINTAIKLIEVIAKALIDNLPILVEASLTLTKKLFEGIIKKVMEMGANLVKGLWEGMWGVKDWIIKKIRSLCQSMLDAIMGFFGIASPSKVMADEVGKFMAEGIGVGFGNTMPSVVKAMQEKLAGVTDAFTTELSFGDIPQVQGHTIVSENSYITKNYTNTIETVRQPQSIDLILDGTKVARAIIPPLNNEYNRLGVKI